MSAIMSALKFDLVLPVGADACSQLDGASTTSSKIAAVGETWARLSGVADEHVRTVGLAYEARVLDARVWAVDGELNGSRAVIARLGQTHVLATSDGFHVAVDSHPKVRRHRLLHWPLHRTDAETSFKEAAAYIERLDRENPAQTPKAHLSSFGMWAREAASQLARDDLVGAFESVMTSRESSSLYYGRGPKAANGYHRARVPFYLRQLGAATRVLRSVVPADVRTALWSLGIFDFRLATWLMESEAHRLYRIQALRTQPLLLPLALLDVPHLSGGSMGALAQIRRANVDPATQTSRDYQLARALLDHIDAGKSWVDPLQSMLQVTAHSSENPISTGNIRWLSGRSPRFLWWTRHCTSNLGGLLDAAASLPGNRQPTTKAAWRRFESFMAAISTHELPASFLKGTPCSWSDDSWKAVIDQMRSVRDAVMWATQDHTSYLGDVASRVWEWLLRNATLRQLLNYSDTAHVIQTTVEDTVRREWQAQGNTIIRWDAALPAGVSPHKDLFVIELTTAPELDEEGFRLSHCIGGYVHACVSGQSRIFSVRNAAGASLSSVELCQTESHKNHKWHLQLAQHRALHNRAPTAACEEAVSAFMHAARTRRIDINMSWPHGALPMDRRRVELATRTKVAISQELIRRWPALAQIIVKTL